MSYLNSSRRNFLKVLTTSSLLSTASFPVFAKTSADSLIIPDDSENSPGIDQKPGHHDGPASPHFKSVTVKGNKNISDLLDSGISKEMAERTEYFPTGPCTAWGIPFELPDQILYLLDKPASVRLEALKTKWLVFMHTSDHMKQEKNKAGFYSSPFKGSGQMNENVAEYIFDYTDGTKETVPVRLRHQIGMFSRSWGENCVESVAFHKPKPVRAHHEQTQGSWGHSQTRANSADGGPWVNWLWAWENPYPEKTLSGLRLVPKNKVGIIISAITAGSVDSNPLRWEQREKALLTLPDEISFNPELDEEGMLSQISLDMGCVISASHRYNYPKQEWEKSYNNKLPESSKNEILVEYTAHPEARFHLTGNKDLSVSDLKNKKAPGTLKPVKPALTKVRLRVTEKGTGKPASVKLHIHGESDEYLPPVDRHRIPNQSWFEDYSVDYVHGWGRKHFCTYIPGETTVKLPEGNVYMEVSRGFEIKPVRKVVNITSETKEIDIELERVLDWREKGWVSADTHVHFLSPNSAQLEGAGEGVNVVNLLASQWGELFTNIGDFDGSTTIGSKESGGDGEYLVRVGTENRQHVLGHISLLGYEGNIITPLTTGGPNESAIGDPVESLLTEWAKQCKLQDGVVVLPHFPNPRLENAATIVSGDAHGVEMTSWGNHYAGINPYSLSDWYRYLNCGYFVAAVGGTDKMSASTAVGTIRTYSKIRNNREFTFEEWKESIKRGHTFVTYGPLMNFTVDGKNMGSRIEMNSTGGTVNIEWELASVTVPMSKAELIVNGEVKESVSIDPSHAKGHWTTRIGKSSWVALLVRGHYPDKPEIISAHSSPVMIEVDGSPMMAAADAMTILEQIEGAMAYLDTIGTKSDQQTYKRMRMVLESSYRSLHNRMHQTGQYHNHSPLKNHLGHPKG